MEEIKKIYNNFKKHEIGDFAAQSAFFTILSIIPFAIIFISLIQYINIDKTSLIFYAKEIIPESFLEFTINIIEEIYSKTFTTISISIIFTLWSASKGFAALMRGFHKIYELDPKAKVYYRFRSFLFTLFLIIVMALTFVFLVWGSHIQTFLNSFFEGSSFQKAIEFIMKIRRYGLSVIIFLFFMLVYKFGPQCKLKLKNQILGASFATVFWYVLSYGLSVYLKYFTGFSVMYGSLTTIFLFMIWIYYLNYAILIGAEINSYFK